jgi:hypothetical protein
MNPMHECRGLCLASTAIQKGDLSASISSTDTSPHTRRGIGQHDNLPVHIQNLPDVQHSRMCAVLPWPRMHLCMTHQEPDTAPAGRSLTVSPCALWGDRYQEQVGQQGAFRPRTSLLQGAQNVKQFGLGRGGESPPAPNKERRIPPHT